MVLKLVIVVVACERSSSRLGNGRWLARGWSCAHLLRAPETASGRVSERNRLETLSGCYLGQLCRPSAASIVRDKTARLAVWSEPSGQVARLSGGLAGSCCRRRRARPLAVIRRERCLESAGRAGAVSAPASITATMDISARPGRVSGAHSRLSPGGLGNGFAQRRQCSFLRNTTTASRREQQPPSGGGVSRRAGQSRRKVSVQL